MGIQDQITDVVPEPRRNWAPVAVTTAGVAVATLMIIVSAIRADPLTEMELILFQVLAFGLGLAGSYTFGRSTAGTPPNARSAFRRVLRLYEALSRFIVTIEDRRQDLAKHVDPNGLVRLSKVQDALQMIEVQIMENIRTVDDAMEDWRDLAPEDVRQIERKAMQDGGSETTTRQGPIGV